MKVAVIGGDRREEVLIKSLVEKGYRLSVLTDQNIELPNVFSNNHLAEVVSEADVVIAPMSSTDEYGYLKSTFVQDKVQLNETFVDYLDKETLFLIGIVREELKKLLKARSISYIELARLDNLAIMNAIPTAEGAIQIAIEETEITLHGSKTIVYGLGKVGLTIAWRLKLLGAETYAVTRNKAAIARGNDLGIKMVNYDSLANILPEIDILFNTVPSMVIDRASIKLLNKNSLIIDLASYPGGTDFEAAKDLGIKAIHALGLPGKVAPITAGKILADIIPDLFK